jgi:hypothetical protein
MLTDADWDYSPYLWVNRAGNLDLNELFSKRRSKPISGRLATNVPKSAKTTVTAHMSGRSQPSTAPSRVCACPGHGAATSSRRCSSATIEETRI